MDYQPPVLGLAATSQFGANLDQPQHPELPPPFFPGSQIDSDATAEGFQPTGVLGSLLRKGLRSEFMHVLIIADSGQVARYSLQAVASYAAMLSLTHAAQLDQCAPLPSITDLLASGCTNPVPGPLYAADLEQNSILSAVMSTNR
jgi:hypothetical protein